MRVFQLFKAADALLDRIEQLEDSIDELKRQARNNDLDVSDALEKIQRLAARLAKRAERLETNHEAPPSSEDPLSARIRAQRAGLPKLPTER